MKFRFEAVPIPESVKASDWLDWKWQVRHSLKSLADFSSLFGGQWINEEDYEALKKHFSVRCTPYYAYLGLGQGNSGISRILLPSSLELEDRGQQLLDPLGEREHNPVPRILHRYSDRILFLITDFCSVYCRYCTRKHFTGQSQVWPGEKEYLGALEYIRSRPGIREVILSGGDPLTLSDTQLERVFRDLREIEHVEIIRVGSRMPVVCPMRMTEDLLKLMKKYKPVYLMTHFNHPKEISAEAASALETTVDHGIPVMNQMVLLNGINNHPAIVQALSRRLLYLRVKPYYMFQCDPSQGTDHFRTSIDQSLEIQRELWGHLSGLAMPSLSVDIPDGGGKTTLVPNFEVRKEGQERMYIGWDGREGSYLSPSIEEMKIPIDVQAYEPEWEQLKNAKKGSDEPIFSESDLALGHFTEVKL